MTVSGPASANAHAAYRAACRGSSAHRIRDGIDPRSVELTPFLTIWVGRPTRRARPYAPRRAGGDLLRHRVPLVLHRPAPVRAGARALAARAPTSRSPGGRSSSIPGPGPSRRRSVDAYVRKFGGEDAAAAVIGRITGAAAAVGLELRLDRALRVNTFDAHRLVWFAGDGPQQWAVDRAPDGGVPRRGPQRRRPPHARRASAEEYGLVPGEVESFLAGDRRRRARCNAELASAADRDVLGGPHLLLREPGGRPRRAGPGDVREDHRPRRQQTGRELNFPRSMSRWSETSPNCSTPISRSSNHHSPSMRREPIAIAAGDDRLEWHRRRRLEHDERRARGGARPPSSSMSTITFVVRWRVMSVPFGCTLFVPV